MNAKRNFFQNNLLSWYGQNGRDFPWRRKRISFYKRILSEVLLQRTRAETVASFFEQFVTDYPCWQALDKESLPKLEKYLKPVGLWKRRATSIKALAKEMAKRNGRFPSTRKDVEALPGVGQYIANSILLFCHGENQPLLDVNMARVLERFFGPRKLADIRYDPYLQDLSRKALENTNPIDMNWAILDFSALVCKARNPACPECPLNSKCAYFNQTTQ